MNSNQALYILENNKNANNKAVCLPKARALLFSHASNVPCGRRARRNVVLNCVFALFTTAIDHRLAQTHYVTSTIYFQTIYILKNFR